MLRYHSKTIMFVDGALVYQFNSGEFKSNLGLFDSFFKIEEIATGI